MTTRELMADDAALWHAATHHPFLERVREGTLDPAYVDYLQATAYEPYAVQCTALWALERAYLEAWRTALPGAAAYREYVEHWMNEAYATWVEALEDAANRVLADAGEPERDAFRSIARYERDFWQMAFTGYDG